MTATKELAITQVTARGQHYLDTIFSQAATGHFDRLVFRGIGERNQIFDGHSPIAASYYVRAIELGLFDTTQRVGNHFVNEFQEAAKANTLAALRSIDIGSPDAPKPIIEHSTTFLSACTDIMERLINSEVPDHNLHKNLAQAIQWFGRIDSKEKAPFVLNPQQNRLNRGKVFDPNKLDQKYIQSLAAINATFDFLEQCAPPIEVDMRKQVINSGYNVQVLNIGSNYGSTCPSLSEIDGRATYMLANQIRIGTQMVSLPEDSDVLHENPSVHLASRSLLCANALFVRKNLPDQRHLPYKSRIEIMPDGLRVLFCRTIDPRTDDDKKLEEVFRGKISAFHESYTPVNLDNDQAQTPKDNELPTDNSALDCRIRGSTAAIADNTEYQIEPDEGLRALGVSQISIEMQGSVYMVNIITSQGTNTITLSPDELSGLITNIETQAQGMDASILEFLAKLAISKTKEWISDQYKYGADLGDSTPMGNKIAKRSPHLELLPLGHQSRQHNHEGYSEKMAEKFGTTPAELNDYLAGTQRGTIGLSDIPPHIRKMIEDLIFRAEIRGYDMKWVTQGNSQVLIAQNPPRITKTGQEVAYDPNTHLLQVSFVPGIDDGQRRQVLLKLQFPEITQVANTSQTGSVYISE